MIGEILSQDEINALLGMISEDTNVSDDNALTGDLFLTDEETDAIGEIGNISMGTSATTLFTLLNQKVSITTPRVKILQWEELTNMYPENIIAINVNYKEGLTGTNLLLLKEDDVKKITDIMMGGDGTNISGDLSEFHLSAIAEAMNQMVGSASTSISQMLNMKIDINPPKAFVTNFNADNIADEIGFSEEKIVQVAFSMKVGTIIDSEIMQILPIDFAKNMVRHLLDTENEDPIENEKTLNTSIDTPVSENQKPNLHTAPPVQEQTLENTQSALNYKNSQQAMKDIDIQKPQFQNFDTNAVVHQKENMDIIMDVPLEVTVELGRTSKKIREILEFGPGTIIELNRLAGEPVDILVNGKFVAYGEVVVIDENFGVRIAEIINPENRI